MAPLPRGEGSRASDEQSETCENTPPILCRVLISSFMRISVNIATTLDGFIARADGGLDWLTENADGPPEGEDYGYRAFFESVDALVMGRSTFDVV